MGGGYGREMKYAFAFLAALSLQESEPAPNSIVLSVTSKHKDVLRKGQVPQYSLAAIFAKWGFTVESRVQTAWDKSLPKDSVKVVLPPKEGEKAPPAAPAAFTIEGSIDYVAKDVKFFDKTLDLINYVAEVSVIVKDAKGRELKKIAWKNYYGASKEKGEESVLKESESRATRFLTVDLFQIKEIADQVPKDKKEEFEKFLAKEKEQRDKHFDDFEAREKKTKE